MEEYLKDLTILFNMDLLNKFNKIKDAIIITMADGSKIKVSIKKYYNNRREK